QARRKMKRQVKRPQGPQRRANLEDDEDLYQRWRRVLWFGNDMTRKLVPLGIPAPQTYSQPLADPQQQAAFLEAAEAAWHRYGKRLVESSDTEDVPWAFGHFGPPKGLEWSDFGVDLPRKASIAEYRAWRHENYVRWMAEVLDMTVEEARELVEWHEGGAER